MKKNTDAETAEVAETERERELQEIKKLTVKEYIEATGVKARVTVRQGKKLTTERYSPWGDNLLYYGNKRIYMDELNKKWEGKGSIDLRDSSHPICREDEIDHPDPDDGTVIFYAQIIVDCRETTEWDEAKIGEMVQKYGHEFDPAERKKELAEREKELQEFGPVKPEEVRIIVTSDGDIVFPHNTR